MTKRLDIMKRHIGLFGVLVAMAIAPLARADYAIAFQVSGDLTPTLCLDIADSKNSGGATCTKTDGNITVTGAGGTSDSPGTPSFANELSSVATLTNNGSTATTITLWYSAQNFTAPTTGGGVSGVLFNSNAAATGEGGTGSSTLSLESCVDKDNRVPLPIVGGGFCTTPFATLTNPTLTVPVVGAPSNSTTETFSPLSATYSLEQKLVITLAAGDTINISTSQGLAAVPEPMSIALLGGVLLLTGRAIQRKRKQNNTSV
jgi:hypothetical protein